MEGTALAGVLKQCWGWDSQGRGHLGQGTLDSGWGSPSPGPREQRASIIRTCVEQQGCNLKTCNTDCLHFCNPGWLCAEFPYWKEKLHEWGMQRRRRRRVVPPQHMHLGADAMLSSRTRTLAAPSEGPLTALLGQGVTGQPRQRDSPQRGAQGRDSPHREPGHCDHQLRVSVDTSAIPDWGHVLRSWVLIVISVIANFSQICSLLLQEPWENWHWILPAEDSTAQFLLHTFYLQQLRQSHRFGQGAAMPAVPVRARSVASLPLHPQTLVSLLSPWLLSHHPGPAELRSVQGTTPPLLFR